MVKYTRGRGRSLHPTTLLGKTVEKVTTKNNDLIINNIIKTANYTLRGLIKKREDEMRLMRIQNFGAFGGSKG